MAAVERYQYPIDKTSEDWFQYTVIEKTDMLKIPQEILNRMSDIQLLYATADYPYFINASMYGYSKDEFTSFATYCSAFNELQSRKSFIKTLQTYGSAVAQEYFDAMEIARADLILGMMQVYLGTRLAVAEENGSYYIK